MSTQEKEPDTRTTEERRQAELDRYEAEAEALPPTRYFTVTVDLVARTDSTEANEGGIEAAVAEQVVVPTWIHTYGASLEFVGGNVTGVSESDEPGELKRGFGKEGNIVEEEESEPEPKPKGNGRRKQAEA